MSIPNPDKLAKKVKKKPSLSTSPSASNSTISHEIKLQWDQMRYQSIENIQTNNLSSFLIKPFIFMEVAGLQSEKMQKIGTRRSR
jgi:hypothetical protein